MYPVHTLISCLALLVAASIAVPMAAEAELKDVKVGGSLTILGEYYRNVSPAEDNVRWPYEWLVGRSIGTGIPIADAFGGGARNHGEALTSQWTTLHVDASFSDNVRAYIELDAVSVWGDSFRSDYLTGADARAAGLGTPAVYQAHIETSETFGQPLQLRLGRQELRFGSEWLVGANDDGPSPSWGLSFDALRLTYKPESFTVDVWAAKLAERDGLEEDGDTDFYGIYGSYTAIEHFAVDAYWMFLRDAASVADTRFGPGLEAVESALRLDNYDPISLHTVGVRLNGEVGRFDYELEVARQFGEAGQVGALFRPVLYGDSDARYGAWGGNLKLGMAIDTVWRPRVYAGYSYLGGEDHRSVSFADWMDALVNPFHSGKASVSFNRLFSNWSYSAILDGTDLTNVQVFRVGVEAAPSEKLDLVVDLGHYEALHPFDRPTTPLLAFMARPSDTDLGWELDVNLTYHYSPDLRFGVGWDHLFAGKGLRDGAYTLSNGLDFNGRDSGEDADYWYFETGIGF